MEAGQLFVNMRYPAIDEMRAQLETEYHDAIDLELMRLLAEQHVETTMIMGAGPNAKRPSTIGRVLRHEGRGGCGIICGRLATTALLFG
jgi:hypothetical protein